MIPKSEFASDMDDRCDGLFISCSNTAPLLKVLQMIGLSQPIAGYGKLLTGFSG